MHQIRLGPLHRRPIQRFLQISWNQHSQNWEFWATIQEEIKSHMMWWLNHLNTRQGVYLVPFQPSLTLFTDASQGGFGASLGNHNLSGLWTEEEMDLHSNNQELLAVLRAVQHFHQLL